MAFTFVDDHKARILTPNPVKLEIWDGEKNKVTDLLMRNSRTQAGGVAVSNAQFASTGISFKYIALSNSSGLAPANGDTTLAGEITTLGLARVLATSVTIGTTQTALNGTVTTTIVANWTATGTATIYGAGAFSAISVGTLGYEATCTATPVANTYTVQVTWTFNE